MKNDDTTHYDESVLAMLEQAEELKTKGEFDRSIHLLEQLIMAEPTCAEAYEEIGDNYLSMRQLDKSRLALEHAVKMNDDSANAHYLLGFLASLQQDWNTSVQNLERADKLFPNHPEILRCLGWSLFNNSRVAQGIAVLERSNILNPDDMNIMCDLGVCYMNASKYSQAAKYFEKVIAQDPHSDQAKECAQFLQMLQSRQDA